MAKVYKKTDYLASELTEAQRMSIIKRIMQGHMSEEEAYNEVLRETQKTPGNRDKLNVESEKNWQSYLKSQKLDEKVAYSAYVQKINHHGKKQERLFVLTEGAMYNLGDNFHVKRRVKMEDIERVTDSTSSEGFIIHVPKEYDYHFESKKKKELLGKLKDLTKAEFVEVETKGEEFQKMVTTKAQRRGRGRQRSNNSFLLAVDSPSPRSASAPPPNGGARRPSVMATLMSPSTYTLDNCKSPSDWKAALERNYKWSMHVAQRDGEEEVLIFAGKITKINSRGRRQKRLVAVTNRAMYNLTDRVEVNRRVDLTKIESVTTSQKSQEFVVHVPSEYDYWFESELRQMVISALRENGIHIREHSVPEPKLKEYVQVKSKGDGEEKRRVDLPELPALKYVCSFSDLKDKRAHIRAELVTTEQSYCKSLVRFLAEYAYPLDVERNKNSLMQNRNKWVDIFDNFENIVRFHCDFFCPDLQKCLRNEGRTEPIVSAYTWATGKKEKSKARSAPASRVFRGVSHRTSISATEGVVDKVADESKGTILVGKKKETTDIGMAFNKRVTLLKTVYEPYLAGWTKLQEAVKKLNQKSKYNKYLLSKQGETGLSISSFLIMPIQRVPRYVLLIRELVKHTDEEHPEYSSLQRALKSIQKIAKVCDSHIK
eukprot:CAMPEP_0184499808 /NCGR_PEP_ID=MMETSP0113_2-20130426/42556_1 /TAXON_ID=91329 /ORGANISM="Norrisiella sphaerica, Strain BC52" /LENGTH=655 /DNA_ID=CAMNT_0026887859 /DNA_START=89 /DNA_END=2056 /DNA_ORIENTATION=+